MTTFSEIYKKFDWRPILNCPGRYLLAKDGSQKSIQNIIGYSVEAVEYDSPKAKDKVLVVVFEDGGLISYLGQDETLVHTLNNSEGFQRKLNQLKIKDSA